MVDPQLPPRPQSSLNYYPSDQALRASRASAAAAATAQRVALEQQSRNYQAHLHDLQQQIIVQQSIILGRQQAEAEGALRALRRRSGVEGVGGNGGARHVSLEDQYGVRYEGRGGEARGPDGSFAMTVEEEKAIQSNPLAASALARRKKRQSMLEFSGGSMEVQQPGVGGPFQPAHHQRNSSTTSGISLPSSNHSSIGSYTRSSDPPALILSKPGEAYPTTSDEESPSRNSTSPPLPSPPVQQVLPRSRSPTYEGTLLEPRRPSQASSLAAALGNRRPRPASIGVPSSSLPLSPAPRSASDTTPLSARAPSFLPHPLPSPFDPSYRSSSPSSRSAYGTSFAVRQPRGPAPDAELGTENFGRRLRQQAIAALLSGGQRRESSTLSSSQ